MVANDKQSLQRTTKRMDQQILKITWNDPTRSNDVLSRITELKIHLKKPNAQPSKSMVMLLKSGRKTKLYSLRIHEIIKNNKRVKRYLEQVAKIMKDLSTQDKFYHTASMRIYCFSLSYITRILAFQPKKDDNVTRTKRVYRV